MYTLLEKGQLSIYDTAVTFAIIDAIPKLCFPFITVYYAKKLWLSNIRFSFIARKIVGVWKLDAQEGVWA